MCVCVRVRKRKTETTKKGQHSLSVGCAEEGSWRRRVRERQRARARVTVRAVERDLSASGKSRTNQYVLMSVGWGLLKTIVTHTHTRTYLRPFFGAIGNPRDPRASWLL